MTIADINVKSIKIEGTEAIDSTGQVVSEGTVSNLGHLYAGGWLGGNGSIFRSSSNGTTWDNVENTGEAGVYAITFFNNSLFATAEESVCASVDGITWNSIMSKTFRLKTFAEFNDSLFVGGLDGIFKTTDGTTWDTSSDFACHSLAVFNNSLFANAEGKICVSSDGIAWDISSNFGGSSASSCFGIFNNSLYSGHAVLFQNSKLLISSDGFTWEYVTTEDTGSLLQGFATYNNSAFFSTNNKIFASTDGIIWNVINSSGAYEFAVYNDSLVAGSTNGKIISTTNGTAWDINTTLSQDYIASIYANDKNFNIGIIQNDTTGNSSVRMGSDTSDDSGAVIFKGKDGNDYKMYVDSGGILQTVRL